MADGLQSTRPGPARRASKRPTYRPPALGARKPREAERPSGERLAGHSCPTCGGPIGPGLAAALHPATHGPVSTWDDEDPDRPLPRAKLVSAGVALGLLVGVAWVASR